MSDFEHERLRAEIRQARQEANHTATWIIFLLVVIAFGGFGAFWASLAIPGLIIGAIVLGVVLVGWVLYEVGCSWQVYCAVLAPCLQP
jgi:hypothetical protein